MRLAVLAGRDPVKKAHEGHEEIEVDVLLYLPIQGSVFSVLWPFRVTCVPHTP